MGTNNCGGRLTAHHNGGPAFINHWLVKVCNFSEESLAVTKANVVLAVLREFAYEACNRNRQMGEQMHSSATTQWHKNQTKSLIYQNRRSRVCQ